MKNNPFKSAIIPSVIVAIVFFILLRFTNSVGDTTQMIVYIALIFIVFLTVFVVCAYNKLEDMINSLKEPKDTEKEKEQSEQQ